jgi:hypothetical protein
LPPKAIFVPNEDGVDKQITSEKTDAYDFYLEAEPILQALVGRALEQGLIEVKEDYERQMLIEHRRKYKQLRESELLETQRLEA